MLPQHYHQASNHLGITIVAGLIVLSVGITLGWILHYRMNKAKQPQQNRKEPIDYPFEEWSPYEYDITPIKSQIK